MRIRTRSLLPLATAVPLALAVGCAPPSAASSSVSPPPTAAAQASSTAPTADFTAGTIVETMDSGGYTYLCIENSGVRRWAAIPQTGVKVGQQVELTPGMQMANFNSKTLNRTFPSIYFCQGLVSSPNTSPQPALPAGTSR